MIAPPGDLNALHVVGFPMTRTKPTPPLSPPLLAVLSPTGRSRAISAGGATLNAT